MALNKPNVAEVETETNVIDSTAQEVSSEGAAETASDSHVQEVVTEQEQVVETVSQEVAVREATTAAPAVRTNSPLQSAGQFTQAAASEGFEDLELNSFSFPTINLPSEGVFQQLGDDESDLGKFFRFQAESSKARYRIAESDDDDAEHFFSPDPNGSVKDDGSDTSAMLAQWAADSGDDNYRPEIKKYLDVVATITEADPASEEAQELVGETVMLSIPKSGQGRFAGVVARGLKQFGGFHNFEIEAKVGRKVKKGSTAFFPWDFKLVK